MPKIEQMVHWSEVDPDKGIETFNWLMANGSLDVMYKAAALVFTDCAMHVKNEQWTYELSDPDVETICRLLAEGDPSRLLPVLNKLNDDECSVTDFVHASQLALYRWFVSSQVQIDPRAPENPPPSSGECRRTPRPRGRGSASP